MTSTHRRRVLVTLFQAVLVLAVLAGCGGGATGNSNDLVDSRPAPAAGLTDTDLVAEFRTWSQQWLDGLRSPGSKSLECPGQLPTARIVSSTPDARGCLWLDTRRQVWLKVQNLSRVPVSVMFGNVWTTLDPGATKDYLLSNPRDRQVIGVQPHLQAAVARAAIDYIKGKAHPGVVAWNECASQLTPSCIFTVLQHLLPAQLTVRGVTIPAQRIVNILSQVWTYEPLARAFAQRSADPGTLTLTAGR